MQALRIAVSPLLGVVLAFSLFVLMASLIDIGDKELLTEGGIKIQDFTMPDTDIEAKIDEELPEQPDEVEAPPPEMETQEVELDSPDNALNISTGAGKFQPNIGTGGDVPRDTDYIPVYIPQARYPARAEKSCKTGYAVVEVTVTTTGAVRDIKMLEEWPENYGFGKSAAKAAEKLKYNPKVVNGVPQEVPGVLYKYTFNGCADEGRRRG